MPHATLWETAREVLRDEPREAPQPALKSAEPARLFAVVATYRRPDIARTALEALLAQTRRPDGIVLVENSPSADFPEGTLSPLVEVVRPGWNTGAAGGFGIGADIALARGATHVVFVDDDCLLDPNVCAALEAATTTGLRHAVMGPVVVTPDRRSLVWDIYDERGHAYAGPESLPPHPVPARDLAFHGLMVSAEALRTAGGPRKDLFFGGPDVEFCLRLTAHGYPPYYLPDARATHHATRYRHFWAFGDRKVPAGAPGHRYYVLRNRLLMWRLYHRDPPTTGVGTVIAREVAGALLCDDRWPRLRLLATAVRDALTGDPRRTMVNAVPLT